MAAQDVSIIFLFFLVAWIVFQDRKREYRIASQWRKLALRYAKEISTLMLSALAMRNQKSALFLAKRFNQSLQAAVKNAQWINGEQASDRHLLEGSYLAEDLLDSWIRD